MEENKSGFDEFKAVLSDFKGLSLWALGASATAPFVASLIDFDPPWPRGIVPATAILELVALAVVFQLLSKASRKAISATVTLSAVGFAVSVLMHLFLYSLLVFYVDTTGERFIRGLSCTSTAELVFTASCPLLNSDEISTAGWEAERLWTMRSIALARMLLVASWGASFIFLSILLGTFISYQRRVRLKASG